MITQDVSDPLFSNDLVGFIKLLASLIGVVLVPITIGFYKALRGPQIARIRNLEAEVEAKAKELKEQINGLGGRVGQLNDDVKKLDAAAGEERRRVDKLEFESRQQGENMVRIETRLQGIEERSQIHKQEIIDAFQKIAMELRGMVSDVDKKVYGLTQVLDDRAKREA